MKPRSAFIDLLKGLLIILVTVGHGLQFGVYKDDSFWEDPLFKFIYMFHMPFFMGVAGYLSRGSIERTPVLLLIKKKFLAYAVPAMIWPLAFRFGLIIYKGGITRKALAYALVGDLTNWIWFLWALFFSILITALVRKVNDRYFPLVYFLSFPLLLLLDENRLPAFQFSITMLKYTYPFFQVGYIVAKEGIVRRIGLKTSSLWLAGIISGLCYITWTTQTFIYVSGTTLSIENLPRIINRYVAGFAISLVVLRLFYFSFSKLRERIPAWATNFGRDSIAIFLIQGYLFLFLARLKGNRGMTEFSFLGWILAALVGIAVCWISWLIGRLLMRRRIFDEILFGRRRNDLVPAPKLAPAAS